MSKTIVRFTTVEPEDPSLCRNGGDYFFGITALFVGTEPVAARHWSSAEWGVCPGCGQHLHPLYGTCSYERDGSKCQFQDYETGAGVPVDAEYLPLEDLNRLDFRPIQSEKVRHNIKGWMDWMNDRSGGEE